MVKSNQTWWDAACNMQSDSWWQNKSITSEKQFWEIVAISPRPEKSNSEDVFMLLCFMSYAFDKEV